MQVIRRKRLKTQELARDEEKTRAHIQAAIEMNKELMSNYRTKLKQEKDGA